MVPLDIEPREEELPQGAVPARRQRLRVKRWKAEQLTGTLPAGSEAPEGKRYKMLTINDVDEGFIERHVPVAAGGGTIPLEQGMLIEVDTKGRPVNETVRQVVEENPEGYTLE